MSGALPETERERQLRQLADRLLTWPDPEGPITADLIPVGYPDDLPPELVDRTELRFFGSLVRRRAGALIGAEMVFEGPGEPEVVVSSYEASLVGIGWERFDQAGPMRGGFDAEDARDMIANMARSTRHEESMLPRLKPPPGLRLRPEGTGGGGGMWKSDARAQTEMSPMELEAYFAK